MNISVRTAGSGDYATIADDTDGDLIDYRPPVLKFLEQVDPLAGSAQQFVANRGNGVWTLAVPIRQFFDSAIAARQAIATLGAALNIGTMDVRIYDVDTTDATYLPACSCGDFTPASADGQTGVAIHFTLKFTGPTFTTTAP